MTTEEMTDFPVMVNPADISTHSEGEARRVLRAFACAYERRLTRNMHLLQVGSVHNRKVYLVVIVTRLTGWIARCSCEARSLCYHIVAAVRRLEKLIGPCPAPTENP